MKKFLMIMKTSFNFFDDGEEIFEEVFNYGEDIFDKVFNEVL